MPYKTDWEQKRKDVPLHTSGSRSESEGPVKTQKQETSFQESGLFKAGLAIVGGLIFAALAKGVKDSDYYDRDK